MVCRISGEDPRCRGSDSLACLVRINVNAGQSKNDAYYSISTITTSVFRRATINTGSNDAVLPWFVRECWLGACGTRINLGNNYVDVRDTGAVLGNGKCLGRGEGQELWRWSPKRRGGRQGDLPLRVLRVRPGNRKLNNNRKAEIRERTSRTRQTLSKFDFQAAMASSPPFAWKCPENTLRLTPA